MNRMSNCWPIKSFMPPSPPRMATPPAAARSWTTPSSRAPSRSSRSRRGLRRPRDCRVVSGLVLSYSILCYLVAYLSVCLSSLSLFRIFVSPCFILYICVRLFAFLTLFLFVIVFVCPNGPFCFSL